MLGQPKHAASPVPGSHEVNCLLFFLQSVHLGILALSGRRIFAELIVHLHGLRPLLALFLLDPHKGPDLHSLFLWLKGRNGRESTVHTSFSIPLKWGDGTVMLVDFLWA